MRVGIIGAGNMGSAFARRLGAAGHDVFITSRDVDDAKNVADAVAGNVRAVPQRELADQVDLMIAATPYAQQINAIRASGSVDGKIVVEISNPLTPDMSGLAVGHTTSAAEEVAKSVPVARVVKAFNTVFAQVLGSGSAPNAPRVQVFYAGDDDNAKSSVRALIESMGFEPVDAGPLRHARYLEPLGMLNIYFGYMAKMGTDIALSVRKISAQGDEARTGAAAREQSTKRVREEEERPPAG